MDRAVWAGALLATLLAACGSCIFPNTVVGCYDVTDLQMQPEVYRWQKRGQFGHTDPGRRKEDMIECGVPKGYPLDNPYPSIFYLSPGETTEQMLASERKFKQCMKDKDYVQLGLQECGPVKENRGICK
jgi:hypothetical protein